MYQGVKQGGIKWPGKSVLSAEIRSCAFCQLDYVISWVPIYKLINVRGGDFQCLLKSSSWKTSFRKSLDRNRKVILTRLSLYPQLSWFAWPVFFLHHFHSKLRAVGQTQALITLRTRALFLQKYASHSTSVSALNSRASITFHCWAGHLPSQRHLGAQCSEVTEEFYNWFSNIYSNQKARVAFVDYNFVMKCDQI